MTKRKYWSGPPMRPETIRAEWLHTEGPITYRVVVEIDLTRKAAAQSLARIKLGRGRSRSSLSGLSYTATNKVYFSYDPPCRGLVVQLYGAGWPEEITATWQEVERCGDTCWVRHDMTICGNVSRVQEPITRLIDNALMGRPRTQGIDGVVSVRAAIESVTVEDLVITDPSGSVLVRVPLGGAQ